MNRLCTGHRAYTALSALFLSVAGLACSSEGSSFDSNGGTGSGSIAGSSNGTAGSSSPGGGTGNGTAGSSNGTAGSSNPGGGTGNGTAGSSNPGGGTGNGTAGDTAMGGTGGTAPMEACPKPAGEICHEFYANDNARNQLNYINEFDPTKNWTKPVNDTTANSGRQIEMVDNPAVTDAGALTGKALMISVNKGFQEYHPITGERLANVSIGTTGVRGAVRLKNGNTILGVGDNKLRTVDKNGATVGTECTLPGAGSDSLRVLTLDEATGNILLGRLLDLFIVNQMCQQQWTAKLPAGSKAYSVFPRAGGGVFATSGDPSTVIEFDQAGQIVGQVGGKTAHPGVGLDFFSGFERLPNGNVVAANWQGHITNPNPTTPHLVEFTPDNKLVWKWGNQDLARQITNTLILR